MELKELLEIIYGVIGSTVIQKKKRGIINELRTIK